MLDPVLVKTVALLTASITIVPLFKFIGLGAVLGYLVAGIAIGLSGLIDDPSAVVHMAEFGVVMFLFIIGLEMKPERLWGMRKAIFGLGLLQVVTCGLILTTAGIYLFDLKKEIAFVIGMGFSLSSTAIVMQVLEERGITATAGGQRIVSTLLFEDLAIVPLLAMVSILAPSASNEETNVLQNLKDIGVALTAVGFLVIFGKWIVNPLFQILSKSHLRELMTAGALLVVLGASLAMEWGGLSMAMGAFVAGVMLSESSFRHQIEADIEPFRGLLLGLFFMGVGMSLDLQVVAENTGTLAKIALIYIFGKGISIYAVARICRLTHREALSRVAIMSHGGEFAFVLFASAVSAHLLDTKTQALFSAGIIVSMVLSPLWLLIKTKVINPMLEKNNPQQAQEYDLVENLENHVLVVGFGRFNQIVCQTLLARGIPVTVIDSNIERIRSAAKFGFKVYYGDGARLDVLHASGLEKVSCVVVGIGNPQKSLFLVEELKKNYPLIPVLVRTYDRRTAVEAVRHHVDYQIRETFESAIALSFNMLKKLGLDEIEAQEVIHQVRQLDEERLQEEILNGFDVEVTKKYWTPRPLVQPHAPAEALNPEAQQILQDAPKDEP